MNFRYTGLQTFWHFSPIEWKWWTLLGQAYLTSLFSTFQFIPLLFVMIWCPLRNNLLFWSFGTIWTYHLQSFLVLFSPFWCRLEIFSLYLHWGVQLSKIFDIWKNRLSMILRSIYLCPEVELALGNFEFPCLHSIMSGSGRAGSRSTWHMTSKLEPTL